MLVGKRPRPQPRRPMQRTTSMTGITTVDITADVPEEDTAVASYHHHGGQGSNAVPLAATTETAAAMLNADASFYGYDPQVLAMLSPRNHRRINTTDFLETSHFLGTCGFCKRRLAPAHDIYMYKGDAAFCSVDCRQQQIERDEKK